MISLITSSTSSTTDTSSIYKYHCFSVAVNFPPIGLTQYSIFIYPRYFLLVRPRWSCQRLSSHDTRRCPSSVDNALLTILSLNQQIIYNKSCPEPSSWCLRLTFISLVWPRHYNSLLSTTLYRFIFQNVFWQTAYVDGYLDDCLAK